MAFAPHGRTLAAGESTSGSSSTLKLYRPPVFHEPEFATPSEPHELTDDGDAEGATFDYHIRSFPFNKRVNAIAWSPDGALIFVHSKEYGAVAFFAASAEPAWKMGCFSSDIGTSSLVMSRDGTLLSTVLGPAMGLCAAPDLDDLARPTRMRRIGLSSGDSYVVAQAFCPAGSMIASGDSYGAVRLWSVASGKCHRTIQGGHGAKITALEWSPNGRFLATGDAAGWTQLWRIEVARDVVLGLALRAASRSAVVELMPFEEEEELAIHRGVAAVCRLAEECPVLVGEVLGFV